MALDFRLCQKCPHGEYEKPEYDDDGTIARYPSVTCDVNGEVLLVDNDIPVGCPYVLEHMIVVQDIPEKHIQQLSGKGEVDET